MTSGNNILRLDYTVSESDFQNGAKHILQHIRPDWKPENIKFKVFTDGITNKLLGCSLKSSDKAVNGGGGSSHEEGEKDTVLVRLNGQGTELIIDRAEEPRTFQILAAAHLAPPVYCLFNNGMAYGFFHGEPLDEKTVREPKIQRLIAEQMVKLHKVAGPCKTGKPECALGHKLQSMLNTVPTSFADPDKQQRFASLIPSKAELQTELDDLIRVLDGLNMDIVYSHNDLLLKNIIYNNRKGTIHFIDYEYTFYNYEGFDIADHFAEYAGIDEVDYNLYPSKEEQLPWLRHYLESKAESKDKPKDSVTDVDVERFYVQVNKSTCATHLFWGLWALIQAVHSAIDFDYVEYSNIRLTEYFRRKEEFFPMQLPS